MTRKRLPQQQDLLSDLLTITHAREEVERLLEHVVRLQSETISLAAAYGLGQVSLADVARLSRQRIGQIADQVDASALSTTALHRQIHQVEEWPGDVMAALTEEAYPPDYEDPDRAAARHKQITVVYGAAEADRHAAGRADFIASIATDPAQQQMIADRAQRRHRILSGDD